MDRQEANVRIRHPRMGDAQKITEMVALCDLDDFGVPDITLDDVLHMWSSIQKDTDAWVALSASEAIIGYAFVELRGRGRIDACVFVHPAYKQQGIGTLLLATAEERAAAMALAQGAEQEHRLMNHIPFTNAAARNLVEKRGYEFVRLYKRMKIELTQQPAEPTFPLGVNVRAFQPNQDEETLYALYDETFRDSWGYSKIEYADWIQQQKGDAYDPSLWFIVREEEAPAAFLMGKLQEDGLYVELLGVRREWRKRGIGYALLLHAFQAAFQKGQRIVHLSVDSNSLTNAQHVYERAGMRPVFQTALYQKVLCFSRVDG